MTTAKRISGFLLLALSLTGLAYLGKGITLKLGARPPQPGHEAAAPAQMTASPSQDLKPWEQQTLQRLAALRYAVYAYKSDNGNYPETLQALVPVYMPEIPAIKTAEKERPSAAVRYSAGNSLITNAGGWAYVGDKRDPGFGSVFVNSYSRDSGGEQWFAR